MIIIPSSLFYLDREEQVLRRVTDGHSGHGEEERKKEDHLDCYCLPGKIQVDALCLWRDSPNGTQHFVCLNDSELSLLDNELQFLPSHCIRTLRDADFDKLSQVLGISAANGEFSRNSLMWNPMASSDGVFYLRRCTVMIVEINHTPYAFALSDHETSVLKHLNWTRIAAENQHDREDFFLKAALGLISEKHQQETIETDAYRRAYSRSFPASNELMMFGLIKKRNKNLGWKERFVALAPGRMFYVEKMSASLAFSASNAATSAAPNMISGPLSSSAPPTPASSLGTPKVIPLIPGKTWCRPASESSGSGSSATLWNQSKYDAERVFELLVTDEEASSSSSFYQASMLSTQLVPSGGASGAFSMIGSSGGIVATALPPLLGSQSNSQGNIRSSGDTNVTKYYWACDSKEDRDRWVHFIQAASSLNTGTNSSLGGDAEMCSALRYRVQRLESVDQHLTFLQDMEHREVRVPVEWIQRELNRPRGELDASMEQAIKDTARDAVIINGKAVFPCTASSVIGSIAKHALSSASDQAQISEEQVLNFARVIFLATNRTQSGGLMWEAANLVVAAPQGTVLIPNNPEKVFPIEVLVEKAHPSAGTTDDVSISPPPALILEPSTDVSSEHQTSSAKSSSGGSGLKRRFHRRTASDPQFFLKFLGGGGSNNASSVSVSSASAAAALPSAPISSTASSASLQSGGATIAQPVGQDVGRSHPTSPKSSLIRGLSMRKKTIESEGLTSTSRYEEHIKVRVHVRVRMEFNLLDENTLGYNGLPSENGDGEGADSPRLTPMMNNQSPRLALIKTMYSRTFCLVEGRSFAWDQGCISLAIENVAKSVPMLEEFVAVAHPPSDVNVLESSGPVLESEEGTIVVSRESLKDIDDEAEEATNLNDADIDAREYSDVIANNNDTLVIHEGDEEDEEDDEETVHEDDLEERVQLLPTSSREIEEDVGDGEDDTDLV